TVPQSLVVEATGPDGAVVTYAPPTVTDVADPQIRVVTSVPSGAIFPIGTTVVTAYAKGRSGVSTTVSFTVTVVAQGNVATVSTLVRNVFARTVTPPLSVRFTHHRLFRSATM